MDHFEGLTNPEIQSQAAKRPGELYPVPPRYGNFDLAVGPDKQIDKRTGFCSESAENGRHPLRSDWMQFHGIVGNRCIRDAAAVQEIHEGNEQTAGAEACFTYSDFFLSLPCGGKNIHDAGTKKIDVLRFFHSIDNIEIAVVIMFIHKIGRDLHVFSRSSSKTSGNRCQERYCLYAQWL